MYRKVRLAVLAACVLFCLETPPSTVQAQGDGLTKALVLLSENDRQVFSEVETMIRANGGRPLHSFPHRAVITEMPVGKTSQLTTQPGVAAVFTEAAAVSDLEPYSSEADQLAAVWNGVLEKAADSLGKDSAIQAHVREHDDALIAPDLPSPEEMALMGGDSATPGYYQTSEYLAGSVAVGIVLVESDGSGDPSTEDWAAAEKQRVLSEIVVGLNWWAALEPRANLSFVYDDHFSNPLPTSVEPISRPRGDQQYWIHDAMNALGFSGTTYFASVRDYNNQMRNTYGTDWAFTIFVVDSSADSDNRFSDGHFAYAFIGGPFFVMTYGNNGYGPDNMDAVAAHETGHIFFALDQYSSAQQPCTRRSGYLDMENQNSQCGTCASNVHSIMRGGIYPFREGEIDPYAAGQVGWRDSDGDGILDPLDTELPVLIEVVSQDGTAVTVTGSAEIIPYPSPSRGSVTINTLTAVRVRLNGGEWRPAAATDGAFDGTVDGFQFTAVLPPGHYTLEFAAEDAAGNVSSPLASEILTVLDPIDGGLNTELNPPDGGSSSGGVATMTGVAYHVEGRTIATAEYRLNGGDWLATNAQDGAFDSDYEPFVLVIDLPEVGTYTVDARAIDIDGVVEINYASHEVTIGNAQTYTVFLPRLSKAQP
jgi:hypothetical protein